MKITIKEKKEADYISDALILPLAEGEGAGPYREVDTRLKGLLGKVIESGEFRGKPGQFSLVHTLNMIGPGRVLLAGVGKKEELTAEKIRQCGGKTISFLRTQGFRKISLSVTHLGTLGQSPLPFVEGALLSLYSFDRYRHDKEEAAGMEELALVGKHRKQWLKAVSRVVGTVSAVNFARDLINTPANDMTPTVLAKTAARIARGNVSLTVLGKKEAEKRGMGAYLSVARGSAEPPRFIVLKYRGGRGAPVALVGKAITFDSGGISIKPSEGMEKMKYDMAGGAVVLAVIKAASEMRLPVNLVGILPATENLPSGSASKPGDVVRALTGKTVEIISTDAEGRLVLADGIGYVKKMKPRFIIDVATLTGACSIALGNEAIAMMGNDDDLMERLRAAGEEVYERVWQMPLFEEYMDYIKSDVADIKNSGGKTGSLVTAGYFLKQFAGDTPWVHLDIAGTAWSEKDRPYLAKGPTGVGVRLLLAFLKEIG